MTGPSGNRLSFCPLRFRNASLKISIDLGCALVNRNSGEGILNLSGPTDLPIRPTLETMTVASDMTVTSNKQDLTI